MSEVKYHTITRVICTNFQFQTTNDRLDEAAVSQYSYNFPWWIFHIRRELLFPSGAAQSPWQCTFADPLPPPTNAISLALTAFFISHLYCTQLRLRFPVAEVITFYDAIRRRCGTGSVDDLDDYLYEKQWLPWSHLGNCIWDKFKFDW